MAEERRFFSVDVETNGLYGPAFAIAVTVANERDDDSVTGFVGRCPIVGSVNTFVKEKVLPTMEDMRENYATPEELEEAFWEFWMRHRGSEDKTDIITIAHCPDPVETGLFRRCVERDVKGRQYLSPWPFHDLGILLLLAGLDPTSTDYCKHLRLAPPVGPMHNPIVDSEITLRAWKKLFHHLKDERTFAYRK